MIAKPERPILRQNELILRQCLEFDEKAIAEIERECFGPDAWQENFLHFCIQRCAFPGIFLNDHLSGYGTFRIKAGVLHIDNLAVRPIYRERGLGSILLGYILNEGLIMECTKVLLQVEVTNRVAINMYKRAGFHIITRLRSYYQRKKRPNGDAYLMQGSFGDTSDRPGIRLPERYCSFIKENQKLTWRKDS